MAALAVAIGLWAFRQPPRAAEAAPPGATGRQAAVTPPAASAPARAAPPVETAPVEVGKVVEEVEALGTLAADESVVIAPEIAGR